MNNASYTYPEVDIKIEILYNYLAYNKTKRSKARTT